MKQVVVEKLVTNSLFREPTWHFKFTDRVIDGRRTSSYFVPTKKGEKQLLPDTEWTRARIEDVLVGHQTAVVTRFDPKGCRGLSDDPRNCCWLCTVTDCTIGAVKDPTRSSWHEVSKVQHCCLA